MPAFRRRTLVAGILALGGVHGVAGAQAATPQGLLVYVVAPSPSTIKEAQKIMRFCRWTDTMTLRDADMVLVVVRSSGSTPLASLYDSLKWLRDDASSQLNESGAQFHTYLYSIRKSLALDEANHRSYDAEDEAGDLRDIRLPRFRCGFACACW
jgi:hypothetical protein